MSLQYAKPTLDAMTDQSIAEVRGERQKIAEDGGDELTMTLLAASGNVAATLAEQFPDHRETAARAVIAAVQYAATLGDILRKMPDIDPLAAVLDILAYAAEQVVREAGTP